MLTLYSMNKRFDFQITYLSPHYLKCHCNVTSSVIYVFVFTDAYVKIALMHEGRHLKKSKTIIKKAELNPDFDETFAFDVPNKELARVYFRVTVLHANRELHDHRLIGRIYLGLNFDLNAHAHWSEMMQHPRKQIMCWHKIRC